MIPWILVGVIVGCTVTADVLQTIEMKRQGEVSDFRPSKLGRVLAMRLARPFLVLTILCMALSFFAFMKLLTVADLSFAVPATAASFVLDTILARVLLKEKVGVRRWAGAALIACGVALLAVP
jgi:drug/metabolite transporter (DMT)-like permease